MTEDDRTNWERVKAGGAYLQQSLSREPGSAHICGHEYLVFPGVFPAHKFPSTHFFTRNLAVTKGEEVLEIGCGMGVTAIELALRGAGRVVATDLSEPAVLNTRANALHLGVSSQLEARSGDLFEPVLPHEKFDLIYWNIPFIYVPAAYEFATEQERSLFDPGYWQTTRFVEQARRHLKPEGRLTCGFADFGEVDLLEELFTRHSYQWKVAAQLSAWEGRAVHYLLYEARPL